MHLTSLEAELLAPALGLPLRLQNADATLVKVNAD